MNDTVVIYDRVRDNLRKYSDIKIFNLTIFLLMKLYQELLLHQSPLF